MSQGSGEVFTLSEAGAACETYARRFGYEYRPIGVVIDGEIEGAGVCDDRSWLIMINDNSHIPDEDFPRYREEEYNAIGMTSDDFNDDEWQAIRPGITMTAHIEGPNWVGQYISVTPGELWRCIREGTDLVKKNPIRGAH